MAGIDGLLNSAGTLELDGPPRVLNRTIKSPDRAGALVVNGTRCSAALADIPATLEAGFADAEYPIWFRNLCTGEDAARHHRKASPRDHQSPAGTQGRRQAVRTWCRSNGHAAGRVRETLGRSVARVAHSFDEAIATPARRLLRCMNPLMAHRVSSRRRIKSVAIGGTADISRADCSPRSRHWTAMQRFALF
jgi:hypothetical protein